MSLAEGGNIGRTGREEGREARGKWSVGSGSSLSLCHSYDSRVIRLINEIIDHLMGLIINCFSTVSCPISSSSSSLLMLLYSFSLPVLPPFKSDSLCVSEGQNRRKCGQLARTPRQHLKFDSESDGDFRKERFSGSVTFLLADYYYCYFWSVFSCLCSRLLQNRFSHLFCVVFHGDQRRMQGPLCVTLLWALPVGANERGLMEG